MPDTTTNEKTVALPNAIVIRDLAQRLKTPVNTVIAQLMKNGVMSSMNERIDYDTAAIIASDLGFTVTQEEGGEHAQQQTLNEQLKTLLGADDPSRLAVRPPVVVVMGHVDHGKTKLLDAIRKTNIAAGESGGITQHIGAYQVERKGKTITFIDTPGHEAFTAMRSRGAHVADIAILVVAADDGMKPQTKEALQIIRQAGIPFLVAVNKIDKPEANLERVKQQLAEENLLAEDWGGKTVVAPVSATVGTGIDDLLETVLLLAQVEDDKLKADPDRPAIGTVIEAHIDKGEGPVATVLVRTGTLHRGDALKIGQVIGKVKALKSWQGKPLDAAVPSQPAKVLGLKNLPEVGDIVEVIGEKDAKKLRRTMKVTTDRARSQIVFRKKVDEQSPAPQEKQEKKAKLALVLRCDNLGSQEAILESLQKYETSAVQLEVVSKGLGSITEADVLLAASAGALLLGFHSMPTPGAVDVAKSKAVKIFTYTIIYDLLNEVRKAAEDRLPAEVVENVVGHMRVLAVFRQEKNGMVVGGKVLDGVATVKAGVRVLRGDQRLAEGTIRELQSEKKRVAEVQQGSECGIRYIGEPVIAAGDTLEFFTTEQRKVALTI